MKLLGPDAQRLVDASDSKTARQNREVFVVAAAEGWRLTDNGANGRVLVVGYESWPFPIPLVADAGRWRFDTAAGVEEVLARRIGRNELAAIRACRTYVYAQRVYASRGHDSKPKGLYATALRSDPGRHNGLYWPATRGQPRSPLGDLIADAAGRVVVSRVSFQDPGAAGTKRLRARGLARDVRRHRCHDVCRQSGRRRSRKGSGFGHRPGCRHDDRVQPRRHVEQREVKWRGTSRAQGRTATTSSPSVDSS